MTTQSHTPNEVAMLQESKMSGDSVVYTMLIVNRIADKLVRRVFFVVYLRNEGTYHVYSDLCRMLHDINFDVRHAVLSTDVHEEVNEFLRLVSCD